MSELGTWREEFATEKVAKSIIVLEMQQQQYYLCVVMKKNLVFWCGSLL